MIFLITGASHTGKTLLAQRLLERTHFPYLSIDHLKMGLIRSGQTMLTPSDDAQLTDYLWPIVRELIKTVIENRQNLIVEGCYIPFTWRADFSDAYLREIRYLCLVMRPAYIASHFDQIRAHANAIESRLDDSELTKASVCAENAAFRAGCESHGCPYFEIDAPYDIDAIAAEALRSSL